MRPLIIKHRYDPEIVKSILNDIDYFYILFAGLCVERRDTLYLPEKRGNGDITMRCPLHKERTPSFRVTYKYGSYMFKCFGCGCAGTFINLLAQLHNARYITAIKYAIKLKPPSLSESPLQLKLNLNPSVDRGLPF